MSQTLLDKSVHNYNVTVMIYNSMNEDEVYLNYIGYHLKQSAEMTLKYQLEAGKVERAIQGVQEYLEILHESELEMEKEDSELSMNDYEEGGVKFFL